MRLRANAVVVKQLPETLDIKQRRAFFSELESSMNVDRPCIVLDCSKVRQMDGSTLDLLLCCLEEAMKRNGDVRLAAVPQGARDVLEMIGAHRLFEIFDTDADGVNSFHQHKLDAAALTRFVDTSGQRSELAA